MSLAEKIYQKIKKLPETTQAEVLDFVDFVRLRKADLVDSEWDLFSLSSAMRGMEDEKFPEYTPADLKEKFQ